ncbi:MAG: DUF192 domain-containing protein [Coriobacteriales bacterium]|jgi:uncharacterized membrane protein (UPF0127 family)|nr:DUF192 domain-containing protein [Coriobacteriales bacterium]
MSRVTEIEVVLATTLRGRFIGLLDRRLCQNGEALLLAPCASIHSFGMNEPLDVAFIAADGLILSTYQGLPPARLLSCRGAAFVLERRHRPQAQWPQPGDTCKMLYKLTNMEER